MPIKTIIVWLAYLWAFYGFFLIYCALHRAKIDGRITEAPGYVQKICSSYMVPGYIMDVLFNLLPFFGPAIFLEPPWAHVEFSGSGLTFTHRCKWHKLYGSGWRKKRAEWICNSWLVPFDPGHC